MNHLAGMTGKAPNSDGENSARRRGVTEVLQEQNLFLKQRGDNHRGKALFWEGGGAIKSCLGKGNS